MGCLTYLSKMNIVPHSCCYLSKEENEKCRAKARLIKNVRINGSLPTNKQTNSFRGINILLRDR